MAPSSGITPEIVVALATDVGRVRELNEDTVYAQRFEDTDPNPWRVAALLFVADGMGGHRAGEVASGLAGDTAVRLFASDDSSSPKDLDGDRFLDHLAGAIKQINRVVHESAGGDGAMRPGTTLTLCLIRPDEFYIGHVGDSRAYLIRAGTIRQVTRDDSWVAEAVESGQMTEEEARRSSFRNQITKCIGLEPDVEPSIYHDGLVDGDVMVVCSDGLTEYVEASEILDTVSGQTSLPKSVQQLVGLANSRGGQDNISVAAVRVGAFVAMPSRRPQFVSGDTTARPHSPAAGAGSRRLSRITAIVLVGIVGLVVGFAAGLMMQKLRHTPTQVESFDHYDATRIPHGTTVPPPAPAVPPRSGADTSGVEAAPPPGPPIVSEGSKPVPVLPQPPITTNPIPRAVPEAPNPGRVRERSEKVKEDVLRKGREAFDDVRGAVDSKVRDGLPTRPDGERGRPVVPDTRPNSRRLPEQSGSAPPGDGGSGSSPRIDGAVDAVPQPPGSDLSKDKTPTEHQSGRRR